MLMLITKVEHFVNNYRAKSRREVKQQLTQKFSGAVFVWEYALQF